MDTGRKVTAADVAFLTMLYRQCLTVALDHMHEDTPDSEGCPMHWNYRGMAAAYGGVLHALGVSDQDMTGPDLWRRLESIRSADGTAADTMADTVRDTAGDLTDAALSITTRPYGDDPITDAEIAAADVDGLIAAILNTDGGR